MCDTFGVIKKHRCLFAKNSDRSANEVQVIEFIKGSKHKEKKVKLTYIEIDQVKETYSILISRPTWLWGAEMGVNEYGVCIGNEAVFTKRNKKKESIIGMDYLRLALERSKSAKEAVDVIKKLLNKYNQGGNCAYDHSFYYDNSFLIMDYNEIYVLETYANECVYKKFKSVNISNEYILEHKYPKDKLVTYFSKANKRRNTNIKDIDKVTNALDCYQLLRRHNKSNYKNGTVDSICMHEGGLVGDHTTSSMVIELDRDNKKIDVYFTGTSTPCQSLFKYYRFNSKVEYPICIDKLDSTYFIKREKLYRDKIGYIIEDIDKLYELENKIYNEKITLKDSNKLEEELYKNIKWKKVNTSLISKIHWKNKNKRFDV